MLKMSSFYYFYKRPKLKRVIYSIDLKINRKRKRCLPISKRGWLEEVK